MSNKTGRYFYPCRCSTSKVKFCIQPPGRWTPWRGPCGRGTWVSPLASLTMGSSGAWPEFWLNDWCLSNARRGASHKQCSKLQPGKKYSNVSIFRTTISRTTWSPLFPLWTEVLVQVVGSTWVPFKMVSHTINNWKIGGAKKCDSGNKVLTLGQQIKSLQRPSVESGSKASITMG